MGRAPCCDKANVKKGPWSPEEDAKLKNYIEQHGTGGNWIALPQKIGLKRCGKSCRLRWLNYLRPNLKHGGFSEEEDNIICSLYLSIGSRWSIIAGQLPGRTDNDIKNYWNTRLKKKLLGRQRKEQQTRARRGNILKQEIMKRESCDQTFMVPGFMNQSPYWSAEIPVAATVTSSDQDPTDLDQDQATLRSFLIKLGENFSDHQPNSTATTTTNFQYPIGIISSPQDHQLYANTSSFFTTFSAAMNSSDKTCTDQLPNMFQRLENFPNQLCEFGYENPPQLDHGLEGFYGMEMINASTVTASTSGESSSWADISSLVSNHHEGNCQQGLPQLQDSAFENLRYFAPAEQAQRCTWAV
ncbi:hypothetical protein I3843_08G143200 [Carya illinoinensis]|uniref:Uncharacterized protein n=1 Tax=Carya illinoinensis TaxID=32201 RepID=A0A8T1PYF7_CARIL|nr:transcription factor RAX3-like [Carya illinoinensis]KAG2694494.1 hypothetical protein I3760_08G147300 [Carya illinoinensis]KAG6645812.1 hypothetical protein CIPAW_08G149200 [Carya illinoinensis]KAG7968230.1 hypothetical protein I3843_08G143200 [Carya illinoinensis]